MFGYIKIDKGELKVKEYELYKAIYCTLCRNLGKSYGFLSRLTLSYDFTFLALLEASLSDGCDCFEQKRCAFNPLKKCNYCKNSKVTEMPSAAAMIMLYYKILDNIADSKGLKKTGYLILKPLFSSAHKKAAKSHPKIEEIVSRYIENQNILEKENCRNIDRAADPTAKALSEIFMLCSDDDMQKRVLERLGYCMGRYIYLMDAVCDFEDDIKTKLYNVLISETVKTQEDAVNRTVPQIYFCINEAGKAFELLDIKKYKSILGNIIYLGLEDTLKKSTKKEKT